MALPRPAASTIALHWAAAAGVIAALALGFHASGLPQGASKTAAVQIHKSVGMIVLAIALARLVWRFRVGFVHGAAAGWERLAARLTQAALLFATVAAPVSGIVRSISYARPVAVFGTPVIPQLLAGKNEALNEAAGAVHDVLAWTVASLVALHAAAAFKHHFVDRDDTLRRMGPRRRERQGSVPR